jgi:hemoglobin/transferrin/lactoferrin receptor protein
VGTRSTRRLALHSILTTTTALIAAASLTGVAAAQTAPRVTNLDELTITPGKGEGSAVDQMAGVSYITQEDLQRSNPMWTSDIFKATPGVFASPLGDDPGMLLNIRGLQNFGRVAVTLDGARQDFSRNSHAGNGSIYIEPELLKSVTVVRGPVANAYGSGAIGGVVAFETITASDLLRPGETWALETKQGFSTNSNEYLGTVTAARKFNENFDVLAGFVYRKSDDYSNADGAAVPFTAQQPSSGVVNMTFRPAEGHEIKLGGNFYTNDYVSTRSAGIGASQDDTRTSNLTLDGKWTYKPGDNPFWDFEATAYTNRTVTEQTKIGPSNSNSTGDIGDSRKFDVRTSGFDVHNASRVDALGLSHVFTYGVDYFKDTADSSGDDNNNGSNNYASTSSGDRAAWGGFLQWEGNYASWLDVMAAARYDGFDLSGIATTPSDPAPSDVSLTGGRLSPKVTVGVTPLRGITVYGTYAEGYRAPSITETFIGGSHQGTFNFYPNPNLKPETAKTFEAGVNLKFDDVLTRGDAFRAKVSVYHSNVDDYIDIVSGNIDPNAPGTPYSQYQNIDSAVLRGVELEANYDARWIYLNLAASVMEAKDADGNNINDSTPRQKASATLGFRHDIFDYGAQWVYAGPAQFIGFFSDDVHPSATAAGYSLLNLYASVQFTKNLKLGLNIDNVFNKLYSDPERGWLSGSFTYPPTEPYNGMGRTIKLSLTGRIGG